MVIICIIVFTCATLVAIFVGQEDHFKRKNMENSRESEYQLKLDYDTKSGINKN